MKKLEEKQWANDKRHKTGILKAACTARNEYDAVSHNNNTLLTTSVSLSAHIWKVTDEFDASMKL